MLWDSAILQQSDLLPDVHLAELLPRTVTHGRVGSIPQNNGHEHWPWVRGFPCFTPFNTHNKVREFKPRVHCHRASSKCMAQTEEYSTKCPASVPRYCQGRDKEKTEKPSQAAGTEDSRRLNAMPCLRLSSGTERGDQWKSW